MWPCILSLLFSATHNPSSFASVRSISFLELLCAIFCAAICSFFPPSERSFQIQSSQDFQLNFQSAVMLLLSLSVFHRKAHCYDWNLGGSQKCQMIMHLVVVDQVLGYFHSSQKNLTSCFNQHNTAIASRLLLSGLDNGMHIGLFPALFVASNALRLHWMANNREKRYYVNNVFVATTFADETSRQRVSGDTTRASNLVLAKSV